MLSLTLLWHFSSLIQSTSWLRVRQTRASIASSSSLNCQNLNSMLVFDCSWVIDLLDPNRSLTLYLYPRFLERTIMMSDPRFSFPLRGWCHDGCNEAVSDVRPGSDPANIASSWSSPVRQMFCLLRLETRGHGACSVIRIWCELPLMFLMPPIFRLASWTIIFLCLMHKVKYFLSASPDGIPPVRGLQVCVHSTRGQKYSATLSKMSGSHSTVINWPGIFLPSSRYGIASRCF